MSISRQLLQSPPSCLIDIIGQNRLIGQHSRVHLTANAQRLLEMYRWLLASIVDFWGQMLETAFAPVVISSSHPRKLFSL